MKRLLPFFIFIFVCLSVSAQKVDDKYRLPEQLLQYIIDGNGEQAHNMLSESLKDKISATQMGSLWNQLTAKVGDFKNRTAWEDVKNPTIKAYYCTIQFANLSLRCNASFDAEGRADGINFVPAPSTPQKQENTKFKETPIKVITGKFQMPGTFCVPTGKTNVAVVVFASGSGPNDADETIGPNKVFRDIAYGLAENGIASIRFDKRTRVYGGNCFSEGEELNYEQEYLQDIHSAIELVKKDSSVNVNRIFLLGHSMGANVAPLLAKLNKDLKGIIMLSGNARPFEELVLSQMKYIMSVDTTQIKQTDIIQIEKQIANLKNIGKRKYDVELGLPLGLPLSYWKYIANYNHLKTAKSLKCPILIMQGERDYQVTTDDFSLWQKTLEKNKNVSFKLYPKLNHIYSEGVGKSVPSDYLKAIPVANYVISDISEWINNIK